MSERRDAPSSEGYKYPLEDQTIRRIVTAYFPGDNKFQADMCEQAIRKAFRLAAPLKTGAPSAAPAATPPEFETLRLYWNACETNNEAPAYGRVCSILAELHARLESESADLRGKLEQAQKDAERYRMASNLATIGRLPQAWEEGWTWRELDASIDAAIDAALKEASNG